ncbi:hypothetical protein POM88_042127 [Heracleum sosnowskyi]|uniref:F-box domain-containing protein n=1 Tax=Heracleum sosnowskyi TaxID=360622 RepID=A0AAD8HHE8_9APIA|nr:hypothetical protein POM88_042127 [Heracleum sosnowskyi]
MLEMNAKALPEDLIEEIVSRTSPVHACVVSLLSLLSKSFYSAVKSDTFWESFLPVDTISRRSVQYECLFDDPWKEIDSDTLHAFPTKKDLYLFLSDNPLLIDDGAMVIDYVAAFT